MQNNISESSRQLSTKSFSYKNIRILGAGHFGALAVKRLSRRYPDASFLVVDAREEKLETIRETYGFSTQVEDAVSFLVKNPFSDDTWIVPAVPIHVVFLWIMNQLECLGQVSFLPVPEEVDSQVPNPYRIPSGTLYASFATFKCPDACNEPDEICTYTKQPRPGNLFERLAQIDVPEFRVTVVRSLQLAPGVGGYTGAHLRAALKGIEKEQGKHLIATACRCHGVIDALDWKTK